jgi:peptide/nickel transport system substrate-binding protein
MKSITAPDPMTVVFNLCGPNVAFLSVLGFNVFAIYDSDWLIAHTKDKSHLQLLNGTGAYKFDQWQRGTEIDYSRNDAYWGDKATNARGILKWNKETASRLQELQAGTVSGITLVGPNDFDTVSNDSTLQLTKGVSLNTTYLGMNHDYAPWDNLKVRQAIGLALDRQRIVDNFYPPGSEVATHFTPCAIKYACLGDDWPAQNVADAKQLLTDAGFPNGIDTTLSFRANARCYIPQQTESASGSPWMSRSPARTSSMRTRAS